MQSLKARRLYFPSLLVLIFGIGITCILTWSRYSQEVDLAKSRFERDAMLYSNAVQHEIERGQEVVEDLVALFNASQEVSREEFSIFAQAKLKHHRGVQALEWVPKVSPDEREKYEALAQKTMPYFQFTDRDFNGDLVPAGDQSVYLPVYYLEPLAGNEKALGLSPTDSPVRDAAIKQAIEEGATVSSRRIYLVQENQNQYGILFFSPVFNEGTASESEDQRFANLKGLALGVFRIGDLVENALANQQLLPLNLLLLDLDASAGKDFLYFHDSQGEHQYEAVVTDSLSGGQQYDAEFKVLESRWGVKVYAQSGFYSPVLVYALSILLFGFLIVCLLAWQLYLYRKRQFLTEENLSRSIEQTQSTLDSKELSLLKQNAALTHLTCNLHQISGSLNKSLEDITETAARTCNVERVSAWFLSENKQLIRCFDLYEFSRHRHSKELELRAENYPHYFSALLKGQTIIANDAHRDPRTCDFIYDYLRPLGISSMLDIPIRHKGEIVGVVCLEHVGKVREWSIEEIHFATSLTNFICLAVESIQRRQAELKLRQSSDRLSLINCIASSVRAGMSTHEVIRATLNRLSEEFSGYRVSYSTIDNYGRLKVVESTTTKNMPDIKGTEVDLTKAPEYLANLQKQQPVIVSDVSTDYRFDPLSTVMQQGQTVAVLDVPLSHFNDLVGVICIDAEEGHHWQDHEIQIAKEVAEFLELAIRDARGQEARKEAEEALEVQKANLEQLVKERTADLEHKVKLELIVANLSTNFINLPIEDYDVGIFEALKSVGEFCEAERSSFIEVMQDEETAIKNHQWMARGVESMIPKRQEFKLNELPWAFEQLIHKKLIYYTDINQMPAEAKVDKTILLKQAVQSIVLVPIVYGMKLGGILSLTTSRYQKAWSQDELMLFQLVGNMLMNSIERKKYEQALKLSESLLLQSNKKLKDLATIDGLTGIANRRFFDLRIQSEFRRAQREQTPLAIILFDIDYFKQFNDEFGHIAGDLCLKRIAQTIGGRFNRATELAARYGGEEFVVIISNIQLEQALNIANSVRKLVSSLAISAPEKARSSFVTLSGGVACFTPDINQEPNELLEQADHALYLAKSAGRNCIEIVDGDYRQQTKTS